MTSIYSAPSYSGAFRETLSGGESIRIPVESAAQRHDNTYISRIYNTSSSYAGAFGSGETQIDFVMTPSAININTEMYLSMSVTNNSGKAVNILPTWFWFTFTELMISGQTVEQYYPSDMFATWLYCNPSQKCVTQGPYVGYTSYGTTYTPVVLGTGATVEYLLPLDNLSFLTSGVLNDSMRSEIRIRFHQAPLANCIPSGQTGINLLMSNMKLIIAGIGLGPSALEVARRNWASAAHVFPGVNTQVKTMNLGTTSAGVLSGYQVLNVAQGLYSGVNTWAVDLSGYAPEDQISPASLSQLIYYDISQSQINYVTTNSEMNYQSGNLFPLTLAAQSGSSAEGFYFIPFSTHFRSSLVQLFSSGARRLLGTESLRVATTSGLTNCQLTIYLYQLCQFSVTKEGSVQFSVQVQ